MTPVQQDISNICRCLDAWDGEGEPWDLIALADALEDADDPRSYGVRQIIKGRYYPSTIPPDAIDMWAPFVGWRYWGIPSARDADRVVMPEEDVFFRLPQTLPDCQQPTAARHYKTLSEAFLALAAVIKEGDDDGEADHPGRSE